MSGAGPMTGAPKLAVAGMTDAGALADLHAASFANPWRAQAFAALLASPGCFALVARLGCEVGREGGDAGMLLARIAGDDCEIITIGVPARLRGQGIAATLLDQAAVRAAALGAVRQVLEVSTGNGAARRLYARLGFEQCGDRPGYYAKDADGRSGSPDGGSAGDALILARAIRDRLRQIGTGGCGGSR